MSEEQEETTMTTEAAPQSQPTSTFEPRTISTTLKEEQEDAEEKEYRDRMKIRTFSSMILLIPTFITALVCGIVQLILNRTSSIPFEERLVDGGYMNVIGIVFLSIFSLNLILVAFDFNRSITVILAILSVAVIAIIFLINAYTGFIQDIFANFPTMKFYLSTQTYFLLSILLFFILLFTFLKSLFNYYAIEGNKFIHNKGLGAGTDSWQATEMKASKEYPDLIEFLIFRSGTLILKLPGEERAHVLKNVIGINKKLQEMTEILERLKVDTD
ncbi:MAG: hypothetical protein U9O98_01645 [Asgard group archaeon]|nr:hypothetical protein [Asgard group archaeon]